MNDYLHAFGGAGLFYIFILGFIYQSKVKQEMNQMIAKNPLGAFLEAAKDEKAKPKPKSPSDVLTKEDLIAGIIPYILMFFFLL